MANGRLGSAKLTPVSAALLYSNTSGSQAVINVQATALSSTTNANMALSVDSATVSLNQTTTATTIGSGSVTQAMYNLDPLSNNRPLRYDFLDVVNASNSNEYPVSYWDGSAWFKPSNGFYGAPNWQKIDPYFLTNPSAYGKTSATLPVAIRYSTSVDQMRYRYSNVGTMTGTQFANMQQFADSGVAYTGQLNMSYSGFGLSADPYSNWVMGTQSQGYMEVANVGTTVTNTGSNSSPSLMYQMTGGTSISGMNHKWYAPRVMGSNGLFIVQPTGYTTSIVCLVDPDLAVSLGSPSYAITWNGTATAGWWYTSSGVSSTTQVGWFEYNPNDGRYYLEQVAGSGYRSILSFTRATANAWPTRGNTTSNFSFTNTAIFTNHGSAPWAASGAFVMRPIRIGAALWWTVSDAGTAYVSTDLKTWTVSTTYYAANSYPTNTFNVTTVTPTSYLYAQTGTANISRFTSGFANVSQTAVLEYNTSMSNYQRTGILLSNGDKLYAQNYGNVDFSATVMGYEG